MKAVIMAGGEGSRLRPLTCDKPKPMVPVMNRPLMEYSVEHLRRHGFRDIAVTLQYLPEKIKDHFGSGGRFGVNLHYYVEEEPLGTAGSVKNAAAFLDETFVVVSGDALTDFDLTDAMEYHRVRGSLATLVLKTVDNPLEYGVVMIDPDGRIVRFLEKPGWGEVFSDTVNTGIYILEPEVLDLVEPGKMVDWSKDIFPLLLSQGDPLFGCVLDGFWCDVGDIKEYLRAHREVLDGRVQVSLKGREVEKGIWLEENVHIHPGARLQAPLYVGAGSSIGDGARLLDYSVLGSYTRIEERASVKRGLTWEGAFIGKGAALRGAILCSAVQLNSRSTVYEEAVIGDGSIIHDGAAVKPGVKVWPAKEVENGVILTDSLIWGGKASRTIFGKDGIRGEINRSITPEMAVRFGAVYGAIIKKGSVLVSGDGSRSSAMLRDALMAGLLSTGVCALDAGELLMPMARRAVQYLKAQGGIHVTYSTDDPGSACIAFLDGSGLPLSRGMERKIEQLYLREDFHRPPGDGVGEAVRMPNLTDLYRRELLQSVSQDKIARAGFRIILDNPSLYMRSILVPLLQQLGCTVITVNLGMDNASPMAVRGGGRLQRNQKEANMTVRANNATLGIALDPGGEKALLYDEMGRTVQGDMYTALLSLLVFRERRGNTVAVPVSVSHVVEKLAERYQGKVLRTKADPRFLLEAGQQEQQWAQKPISLSFDAIAALVYLLDLLASHDLTLSALMEEIPSIKVREREIPCPWTQKGKVMRQLIQESAENKTEMIDGLKIYHPQGWALIMPDPEKPTYHVYSEGYTEEVADSLTDFYVDKITSLQRERVEH